MNKQKISNLFILSLLFALGIIYGAQVFTSCSKSVTQTVMTDTGDDSTENSEEKVNETSHLLFLHEKVGYHLKPSLAVKANLTAYICKMLPETYLKLNTPPPDFALS